MLKIWHYFVALLLVAAVLGLLALRPDVTILFSLLAYWALVGEFWVDSYLVRRERIQSIALKAA